MLLATYYLLLTSCYLLLARYYLLLTSGYLLLVTYYLLITTYYLLLATYLQEEFEMVVSSLHSREGRLLSRWLSLFRCGVVWCGVVWCGVMWCGVEVCGSSPPQLAIRASAHRVQTQACSVWKHP